MTYAIVTLNVNYHDVFQSLNSYYFRMYVHSRPFRFDPITYYSNVFSIKLSTKAESG